MGELPMSAKDAATLRAAAAELVGIQNHPRTVTTELLTAPNGQTVLVVMEITRGPLKIHTLKVNPGGDIHRVRNGR